MLVYQRVINGEDCFIPTTVRENLGFYQKQFRMWFTTFMRPKMEDIHY